MSKDFLYGVIAVCTALILLIGAYMAMPERDATPALQSEPLETSSAPVMESTVDSPSVSQGSSEPGTKPTEPTEPATKPTEPTEPATKLTEPTEPATKPTEPTEPATKPTEPTEPGTKPTEPTEPATKPTEPTEPATKPTEPMVPTEPEETVLKFITWPYRIMPGNTGTVTIQGKPYTSYTIEVYYTSGPSGAKGLEEKCSDGDGIVTWTWKVSKNTKPGDFKIVVTGGGETAEVPFFITE